MFPIREAEFKKSIQNIFEPGFTTKKRGWGLGLSLSKRIVEEYHNGTIKVLNSIGKGTTMQVSFKKVV
jgi:signal transduction histidine kinase